MSGDGVTVVSRKKERPFHPSRKVFHILRSLKNSLLRRMWWKRLCTPLVRSIIGCRKVLPGTTALQASCRVPISDWSSIKRTERRPVEAFKSAWVRRSLSSGSRASIRVLSSSIPMNSKTLEGPRVLYATTGLRSDMNTRSNVLKLDKHCRRDASAMKKSSKM